MAGVFMKARERISSWLRHAALSFGDLSTSDGSRLEERIRTLEVVVQDLCDQLEKRSD
jgi:hypothetical protein